MALDIDISHYNTGTATVGADGTEVTGQGTTWTVLRKGDLFGTHIGMPVRIAAINSDTSLTLAYPWRGPAQATAPYEIQRTPFDIGYLAAIEDLLRRWGGGNVDELADLTLEARTLLATDSNGELGQTDLSDFMRGLLAGVDGATVRDALGAGTGNGDFVGPDGGVADGDLMAFADETGKLGRKADPSAVTALLNAFVGDSGTGGAKGLVPAPGAGDGAAGKLLDASGAWVLPPVARASNLLMNSDFAVNQRGYVSGTLPSPASTRTFDRWLVWSSAQTVTFNSAVNRTITIGGDPNWFYQMVQGSKIEGGNYVLTWSGTATAQVLIGGAWTGVTRGVPFNLPAGQNTGVRFQGGTLAKPKLEMGDRATPWEKPDYEASLEACKAYYQMVRAFILFTAGAANSYVYVSVFLGATMRAIPTVSTAVLFPETNMSAPLVDEISSMGCRIYGQAINPGSVAMWRAAYFDAELTG